jgi:hypothetical protein
MKKIKKIFNDENIFDEKSLQDFLDSKKPNKTPKLITGEELKSLVRKDLLETYPKDFVSRIIEKGEEEFKKNLTKKNAKNLANVLARDYIKSMF